MDTITIILTIMAVLLLVLLVITYLKGGKEDTPTPTKPVEPTPTPKPNVEVLRGSLVSSERVPISLRISNDGDLSTSPFFRGNLSGSVVERLNKLVSPRANKMYYRITELSTNNAVEFSTPLENTDINMKDGATFKLVAVGKTGDAFLACDMTIYDSETKEAVVIVEIFLNIIGQE